MFKVINTTHFHSSKIETILRDFVTHKCFFLSPYLSMSCLDIFFFPFVSAMV